ncbi:MAG: DUF2079 domain-containing protein [Nitrospirae bacterium]|nr:DUF2079 domain-containing protein [Nitrospirota bacterium]
MGDGHQKFYNNLHGRFLQFSLDVKPGQSGEVADKIRYLNQFVININPALLLLGVVYRIRETLDFTYLFVIVFVYMGMIYYTWMLLRHTEEAKSRFYFAISLLLLSCFLVIVHFCGNRGLIAGPFIMASYYYLREKQWLPYGIATLFGFMVSEDTAMLYMSFSLYIFIFENKKAGLLTGMAATLYTIIALFIIYPAARYNFNYESANHAQFYIELLKSERSIAGMFLYFIGEAKEIFAMLLSVVFLLALVGRKDINLQKLSGIIFLAPLSHWGIVFLTKSGGHHEMHILVCIYLAMVYLIANMDFTTPFQRRQWLKMTTIAAFCLFFFVNIFLLAAQDFPYKWQLRWSLRSLIPTNPYYMKLVGQNLNDTMKSNKEFIEYVEKIPKEYTLVFLANRQVVGFITNRPNIWSFPNYYSESDYLVIQRGARNGMFCVKDKSRIKNIVTTAELMKEVDVFQDCAVPEEFTDKLVASLVDIDKTHKVEHISGNVVGLRRLSHIEFEQPPESLGFLFLRNVPKVLDGYLKRIQKIMNPG